MTLEDPRFLSVDEVLALHSDQIRLFGGSEGLRDRSALASAVAMASVTFDGAFLHERPFEMAAAYAFHIAQNQPFLDGNKRTGLNAALVFLEMEGWTVHDTEEALVVAMIDISARTLTKAALALLFERLSMRR